MAAPLTVNGEKTIPTRWRERIPKREFDVVLGKMLQPVQAGPDETEEPYLRSANIQWEGVNVSDVKTMWFSPQEKRDLRLQSGDLLVNEGGDVGRCAVWNGELPECYFQNAINRVRPRQTGSARFLCYWLHNLKDAGFIDAVVAISIIGSSTLLYENSRNPFAERKERVSSYLKIAATVIMTSDIVKKKAISLERLGIDPIDAVHLACAEAGGAEYFVTCDDNLIRKTKRNQAMFKLAVCNPLTFVVEEVFENA